MSDILDKFMNMTCSESSIRYLIKQDPAPVEEIAKIKQVPKEQVIAEAVKVLVEDGVSNEFALNMLHMWKEGTKDKADFSAGGAMLYQHISWTNVEGRKYQSNSAAIHVATT